MKKRIVFFDGYCGLCNTTVDFLISKDKKRRLYFSPLQGETFKRLHIKNYNLDTVVFYDEGNVLIKSKAILRCFKYIGLPYKYFSFLSILPSFILDFFYSIIAKYRHRISKKRESCRLPSKEEKDYFLD